MDILQSEPGKRVCRKRHASPVSVRPSVRLSRIFPSLNAVAQIISLRRILKVSRQKAAAVSVLRCSPMEEHRHRLADMAIGKYTRLFHP